MGHTFQRWLNGQLKVKHADSFVNGWCTVWHTCTNRYRSFFFVCSLTPQQCWVMCKYSSNMIAFAGNNYCNRGWVLILQFPIKKEIIAFCYQAVQISDWIGIIKKALNPAINFRFIFLILDSATDWMSNGREFYIILWKYHFRADKPQERKEIFANLVGVTENVLPQNAVPTEN